MKKISAFICLVSLLLISAPAFARGGYGGYGGYYGGYRGHGGYYRYSSPRAYGYHHGGHNDGEIIAGVAFGLLTGAIIGQAFAPPPGTVYTPRYYYAPPVVVEQRRICVEERVVSGEWQQNPYDGTRYWASFPYPMKRRYEVPCY
ncbi:MAG: hypothetical protein WBN83_18630 [Desulfoprunum sp.]|uniref:hypothetical protein n=1 Tax=Desulfoprunum sp. TaxID=2020866 RepID=UPI00068D8DFD